MRYWITAADEHSRVIYNQVIEAESLSLALAAAQQAVPSKHHGSICITDEDNNPIVEGGSHTPTPWYAACWSCHAPRTILVNDASRLTGKRVIAECDRDEDAAFIVRACNSHEQLVAALREIINYAEACDDDSVELDNARAALAAAGVA